VSAASTSPLYTVLLAVGYALNISYTVWPHFLGWLALALTGMIGGRMVETLPGKQRSAMIPALLLVATWHLVWAAASGMETMLFCLWTLLLIALAWRELDARSEALTHLALRGGIFGLVSALATLTRPEGVVLAGLIGLALSLVRPQGWRAIFIWGSAAALSFLIVMSPYLIFNLRLTGGLLPDTAAAKQAEAAVILATVSFPVRLWEMLKPIAAGGQVLLLPGIIFYLVEYLRRIRTERRALFYILPLIWAASLILLYAARLPAPYQHGRYVIPALPSLVLVGAVGSLELLRQSQHSPMGRVLTRTLAVSALLVFVFYALVIGPSAYRRGVRIIEEEMVTTSLWIAKNIAPQELLAVHDIGALGYFAPRPIVDIAGLVSPEVVPFILEKDPLYDYLQSRGARYLMAFPDQVPGDDLNDPRLCRVYITGNRSAPEAGGANMSVYALEWDGICDN
jgi:hypothetical protein